MSWSIERENGSDLDLADVLRVYEESGLGERRPVQDTQRMAAMVRGANLVITCRVDGELVGIARSVSDFSYVTYLSDIAVVRAYQRTGIGRQLIDATRKEAPQAKIVLLSAPAAADYYPHIGFTAHPSAWVLNP
ncbi:MULTISPECIES: GNAT family N-acetyltransferase [unclassified Streptomyces]|uniref:GNAT family N-acetyltransferase n=1 Tax=unclassified Streptomyces TaxID=2593676 RepID=UPI00225B2D8D|nr:MULTISPECIES: GNAT family N-acetyltransferase [unclassified Streptomyces]MCX4993245.1 GNAT family N-acetyltransferase [Streptomyces sp. NBC_00568]MCX5009319.1 GNAT family N-acetyltransferase [Streptomyces sp. NBC_00638]